MVAAGGRTRPRLNPIASSSRLMLTPSATMAIPRVARSRPAACSSSSSPWARIKLALLARAGADPWHLLTEQRAQFGPLAEALTDQVHATTGIEHTSALWRHRTMSAIMQFLDDAIRQV
jgi:hypothetical protein